MYKLAVLLVVGLLTMGCMGNAYYVDKRFDSREESLIRAAAEVWEAAGSQPIDLIFRSSVDINTSGRKVIVKATDRTAREENSTFDDPEVVGVYDSNTVPILTGLELQRIVLDVERQPSVDPNDFHKCEGSCFQTMVEHELGHSLGLSHLPNPMSVMYYQPLRVTLSAEDKKALHDVMVQQNEPGPF